MASFTNGDRSNFASASSAAASSFGAPNRDNAIKFLEFLVSDEGQKIYTEENFEYPVKAGAEMHPIIKAIGDLKPDALPLSEIAKHRKAASMIIDRVGFDN